MIKRTVIIMVLSSLILLYGCTKTGPTELNVMTHDSFAASEAVIKEFETANDAKVNIIMSGDAGSTLNQAILTKSSPNADVLYGVDNTLLSRALKADIFETYSSPILKEIPDQFQLDKGMHALPVDYGDVCINYEKAYFAEKNLSVPQTLDDLLKPEYRGLLVVENPAISSPGLAFLLTTIAHYGPEGYLKYWQQLRANNVVVVNDWNTAYYTNFSGSSGKGAQPLVVSYNTDPFAEVIFATEKLSESPTASLLGPGMCFRQVEFVGILKGTHHLALAQKFVDFMLSRTFQEDIPLNMFVYPVNVNASLPAEFIKFVQNPEQPAFLDPEKVNANLDTWIVGWRKAVLE